MQVSKTLDYAVRSLSYMASSKDENITIKLVSEKQHIPHSYLAKIMRKLVQRGILSSSSGPDGGYFFKRDPKSISLREVYEAIEGDLQLVDCMDGDQVCELFKTCNQRSIWDDDIPTIGMCCRMFKNEINQLAIRRSTAFSNFCF